MITDSEEVFITREGHLSIEGKINELPLFYITNQYLHGFEHLIEDFLKTREIPTFEEIQDTVITITSNFTLHRFLENGDFPLEPNFNENLQRIDFCSRIASSLGVSLDNETLFSLGYLLEVLALRYAISQWLIPKKEEGRYPKPLERYLQGSIESPTSYGDPGYELIALFLKEVFPYRTKSVGIEVAKREDLNIFPNQNPSDLAKKIHYLPKLYTSSGIIPLMWVEIMNALEKGIFVQYCSVCHDLIVIRRRYDLENFLCTKKECEKQRRIQTIGNGDPEMLKKYNTLKMAESRLREKVRKLGKQGLGSKTIAKELGISVEQVIKWLDQKSLGRR